MSGQLLRVKSAKDPKPKHTHVVITFTQGGELRYVDPRTFGEMFVSAPHELDGERALPELAHLGFDPIEDVMSWDRFGSLLRPAHGGLKSPAHGPELHGRHRQPLLRRDALPGRPALRPAVELADRPEVRRLYRAIVETLADAIKHRGSSLADEQYRDLFGEIGDFQGSHQVYDREGQPCRRCRNTIVRVKAGGRSTFFCEHCQV